MASGKLMAEREREVRYAPATEYTARSTICRNRAFSTLRSDCAG